MNLQEFLEENGYKMWNEEDKYKGSVLQFQKRVDSLYPNAPLCSCNEKLFINVVVHILHHNSNTWTSCSVELVHENQSGEWCDIRVYSLTEEQILSNLSCYEDKMIKLWEVFCE